MDDFVESFLSPRKFLRGFVDNPAPRWGLWALFAVIAVVGTWLYGLSFGLVYTEAGSPLGWAWVVTLAAGAGWLGFMPLVILAGSKEKAIRLGALHACLLTMVYGEAILEIGTVLNFIGYWRETLEPARALKGNLALVAVSNVAMAAAITAQLHALGQKVLWVLIAWIVVLNGLGAGCFWILYTGVLVG